MNPKNPNRATQRSALVTQRELTKTVSRLFDLSLTDMCEAAIARQDDIERQAGFLQRMFDKGRLSRTYFYEAKARRFERRRKRQPSRIRRVRQIAGLWLDCLL